MNGEVFKIKRLRTIFLIYWVLLAYVIAALVWWFIALNQQNKQLAGLKVKIADLQSSDVQPLKKIISEKNRKTAQYAGEGLTFFGLIILGAVFVFRAVRRQFRQSQQQQDFMMTITHELKTPIAITRLNLETLQRHKLEQVQEKKLIGATIQETNRLNDLCNNMLLASQIESSGYKITKERINFSQLAESSIQHFITLYTKREINTNLQTGVYVEGDLMLLQMVINNILDNAIKYSPVATIISISLHQDQGKIFLKIKDQGKGIPDKEKTRIFLKFYRIPELNNVAAKGTGLGLYLSKKIVQQHKGELTLEDNNPHGSIFTIILKEGIKYDPTSIV